MKNYSKGQEGFSLVEVLIALVILAILGLGVLQTLAVATRATITGAMHTTAESLARTQLENIKQQTYVAANSGEAHYLRIVSVPAGFSLWSRKYDDSVVQGADIVAVAWNSASGKQMTDTGLEKVTIYVKQGNTTVLTLEGYVIKSS